MSASNPPPVPASVTKSERFNYSALAARLVVFALFCFSLGLIWWSYYREFFPYLQQFRELTATASKLSTDLDQMNRRFTPEQIDQINRKIGMVQTNLFADRLELQSWLADLREQSQPLGLDVKADYGAPLVQTDAAPSFLIIPTTVAIQFHSTNGPANGSPNGPTNAPSNYQKVLEFSQRITAREKTDCLDELTVETGPTSIERVLMSFNFWAATNEVK